MVKINLITLIHPDKWINHFKKLLKKQDIGITENTHNKPAAEVFNEHDFRISEKEISDAINLFKRNKS